MSSSERRVFLCALGSTALAGCGFELRQPPQFAFSKLALAGFAPRSALADEFKRRLALRVQVVDAAPQADVVLHAVSDSREKGVVASTAAAQVRELQLRLRFGFRAHTPAGRELIPLSELLVSRDLSYRETAALAKEYEEAELYREMQADLVSQVLRRLASVNL
jgi:LPS-assembly lipoprotein